jgi:peptidoglycan hydrolase CwlO-like protein
VIASLLKHIEIHEQKIREELEQEAPSQSLIKKWKVEIKAAEETIIRRAKRLPRGEI